MDEREAVMPLLEGLEVDTNTYRLGLSQVAGHIVIAVFVTEFVF